MSSLPRAGIAATLFLITPRSCMAVISTSPPTGPAAFSPRRGHGFSARSQPGSLSRSFHCRREANIPTKLHRYRLMQDDTNALLSRNPAQLRALLRSEFRGLIELACRQRRQAGQASEASDLPRHPSKQSPCRNYRRKPRAGKQPTIPIRCQLLRSENRLNNPPKITPIYLRNKRNSICRPASTIGLHQTEYITQIRHKSSRFSSHRSLPACAILV